MKKKMVAVICAVTMMVTSLTGCGLSNEKVEEPVNTEAAEEETASEAEEKYADVEPEYVLKFSGTVSDEHLVTKVERFFADKVFEKSEGRVKIDVYPNCQLGGPREMVEATVMGDCDMVETALIETAGYSDTFKFFNLPFLWESKEAAFAFMKSEKGMELRKQFTEETGLVMLGNVDNGFFNVWSNNAMETPEDCKGFKIRCQQSDVLLKIWEDLGANPMPMSLTELYTALQQGTVDGMMNGWVTPATNKFYEVQKYCHRLAVIYDVFNLAINEEKLNSMPEDLQQVLWDAMAEAEEYGKQLAEEENLWAKQVIIDNGVEIIDLMDPEKRQPWIDAAQATYDWFRETYPDQNVDETIEAIKGFNEKYPASEKDVI